MAFYKKVRIANTGKWYPKSVLVGKPITTDQVARRIAAESTVSPADVRAVLTALGPVMADYMAQGRSVKLDGLGSFYFTAAAVRNGVDRPEEVSAALITGIRVRFLPETHFRGRRAVRTLADLQVDWEELKDEGTSTAGGATPPPAVEG